MCLGIAWENLEKERMADLALMKNDLSKNDKVKGVTFSSDENFNRMRVVFNNGYELSIVNGTGSYGGNEGLYEIAPVNKKGNLDGRLLNDEDKGDDVCGYCDEEKVKMYINKIASLTK